MTETIKSILEWHESTFPDVTFEDQLNKWDKEYKEWYCAHHDPREDINSEWEEMADMFIVACGICRFDIPEAMFCFAEIMEEITDETLKGSLLTAINDKMTVNRSRTWEKIDGEYRHKEV